MNEPTFLGLAVEFEFPVELQYCEHSTTLNSNGKFLKDKNNKIDIRGTLEDFHKLIKLMVLKDCDQELIRYLKKGRDMGAAWVLFV